MARFSFKVVPMDISWTSLSAIWQEADTDGFFDAGWLFDHFYPPRGPLQPALLTITRLTMPIQKAQTLKTPSMHPWRQDRHCNPRK